MRDWATAMKRIFTSVVVVMHLRDHPLEYLVASEKDAEQSIRLAQIKDPRLLVVLACRPSSR